MQKFIGKIGEFITPDPSKPFMVVGLGNPGRQYKNNRHNVGFMTLNEIARKLNIEFTRMKFNAMITKGEYSGNRIILAKPYSFMNVSGQPVGSLVRFHKIPLENLIIIFDDVDLPFGTIRLRPEGGSSGQKGMKSIIQQLGSEKFNRLRIGIGRPPGKMSTPNYVLKDFNKYEEEDLPFILDRASDAILMFLTDGINLTMSAYNQINK